MSQFRSYLLLPKVQFVYVILYFISLNLNTIKCHTHHSPELHVLVGRWLGGNHTTHQGRTCWWAGGREATTPLTRVARVGGQVVGGQPHHALVKYPVPSVAPVSNGLGGPQYQLRDLLDVAAQSPVLDLVQEILCQGIACTGVHYYSLIFTLVVVVGLNFDRQSFGQSKDYFTLRKKKVPFSMAIGHGELMHECFTKHSSMGTARIK